MDLFRALGLEGSDTLHEAKNKSPKAVNQEVESIQSSEIAPRILRMEALEEQMLREISNAYNSLSKSEKERLKASKEKEASNLQKGLSLEASRKERVRAIMAANLEFPNWFQSKEMSEAFDEWRTLETELLDLMMGYVTTLAARSVRPNRPDDFADALQEGAMAAVEAIRAYEVSSGFNLTTLLHPYVSKKLESLGVSGLRQREAGYLKAPELEWLAGFHEEYGRDPSFEEIRFEFPKPVQHNRMWDQIRTGQQRNSRSLFVPDPDGGFRLRPLSDPSVESPGVQRERIELLDRLLSEITKHEEANQFVMYYRLKWGERLQENSRGEIIPQSLLTDEQIQEQLGFNNRQNLEHFLDRMQYKLLVVSAFDSRPDLFNEVDKQVVSRKYGLFGVGAIQARANPKSLAKELGLTEEQVKESLLKVQSWIIAEGHLFSRKQLLSFLPDDLKEAFETLSGPSIRE
ncbi:MAG: hypothetical protein EA369_06435 [Bradymonadales bacterium]|nr:MAG: hypothetical protein EA369_06435 [Bradymonadales bacterium]